MIKLLKDWYQHHFSQPGTIEFAVVLVAIFLIVYYLMWLVGPIVVAVCLAYCLDWGVRALIKRFKISRTLAASITMIAFIGAAVGILVFIAPKIVQQGNQFYQSLQEYSSNSMLNEEGEDFDTMLSTRLYELADNLPDPLPSMVTLDEIRDLVISSRTTIFNSITSIVKNQIMPSVVNAMSYLMYMIIVPIFMFLMLANKAVLQKRVRTYLLPNDKTLIESFWPKINSQIEGYIRGKLCHILIIAVVNTVAFLCLGVNYAFLLGLGVGLSVVIPYVGAVIITIPVVLVAIFQFGIGTHFAVVCVVYLLIQLLDGNLLTPLLFSKVLNLDAFSILLAILIFGGLWGFWGVFFSIPLATFISTLITNWPDTRRKS